MDLMGRHRTNLDPLLQCRDTGRASTHYYSVVCTMGDVAGLDLQRSHRTNFDSLLQCSLCNVRRSGLGSTGESQNKPRSIATV